MPAVGKTTPKTPDTIAVCNKRRGIRIAGQDVKEDGIPQDITLKKKQLERTPESTQFPSFLVTDRLHNCEFWYNGPAEEFELSTVKEQSSWCTSLVFATGQPCELTIGEVKTVAIHVQNLMTEHGNIQVDGGGKTADLFLHSASVFDILPGKELFCHSEHSTDPCTFKYTGGNSWEVVTPVPEWCEGVKPRTSRFGHGYELRLEKVEPDLLSPEAVSKEVERWWPLWVFGIVAVFGGVFYLYKQNSRRNGHQLAEQAAQRRASDDSARELFTGAADDDGIAVCGGASGFEDIFDDDNDRSSFDDVEMQTLS